MQRIDCFNALYVALTRAENNMLIWSKCRPRNNNTVNVLMKCLSDENVESSVNNSGKKRQCKY